MSIGHYYFQIETSVLPFRCLFLLLDDDGNIAIPSVVESLIFIGGRFGFRVVNVLSGRRASECANQH